MKTTIIALAIAASLAGCATSPGTTTTTTTTTGSHMSHMRNVCYGMRDFETTAREARADGVSRGQLEGMTAMANRGAEKDDTQNARIAGTLLFAVIAHVYADDPGRAVDRCIDEAWPLQAYYATQR